MQLENAVIAITGGARGLGFAMAATLGSRGARLALLDTDAASLDDA
ncbi:MAG TPA: short chain dehydrogenase, partial [Halomonas sp.]|nr:short chain dehydrogenase [Halomonas sp.]